MGARARPLSHSLRSLQRRPGAAAHPVARTRMRGRAMNGDARRILITTDAVGGVWNYSIMLARGLASAGDRVTLGTIGPKPSPSRLGDIADLFPDVDLIITDTALEWMDPEGEDAKRAGELLLHI